MERMLVVVGVGLLAKGSARAAVVRGLGSLTNSQGSVNPLGTGEADLVNTGTIIVGLFGTEIGHH